MCVSTRMPGCIYSISIPRAKWVLLYPVDENGELAHDRECGSRLQSGKALVLPEDGCSYDLVADEPYGKDAVWP